RVRVWLEDFRPAVTSLEGDGEQGHPELGDPRASGAAVKALDELLGDGAPALHDPAALRIHPGGANGRPRVHPDVIEEPAVLGGQDRGDDVLRDGGEWNGPPQPVRQVAQIAEHLGLQLHPAHRGPVRDIHHGTDAIIPDIETNRQGRTLRLRFDARANEDLPHAGTPSELAGRVRRVRHRLVAEALQRARKIYGRDRDTRLDDPRRRVYDRRLDQTAQVNTGHRPRRPHPRQHESDREETEHRKRLAGSALTQRSVNHGGPNIRRSERNESCDPFGTTAAVFLALRGCKERRDEDPSDARTAVIPVLPRRGSALEVLGLIRRRRSAGSSSAETAAPTPASH